MDYTDRKYLQEWVYVRVVSTRDTPELFVIRVIEYCANYDCCRLSSKCYELKKILSMWMSQFWLCERVLRTELPLIGVLPTLNEIYSVTCCWY